ncbi:MAG: hypothetical protein JWL90_3446, partial [Chthoniobacteraceae bacterium]|nr:hypothetical protein [Chthoniobacteraceae bacterium]
TGREMLQEAGAQIEGLPPTPYREALSELVVTLDGMIGQFADRSAGRLAH